jgi:hypothetical protein
MPLGLFGTQDFTGIAPEFHRNQFIVIGKSQEQEKKSRVPNMTFLN